MTRIASSLGIAAASLVSGALAVLALRGAPAAPHPDMATAQTERPARLQYALRASSAELAAKTAAPEVALKQAVTLNANPHIPPQCFTKTTDDAGHVHNPCYTCHVSSRAPNFIDDGDLQREYTLAYHARKNPWTNVFVDWRPLIAATSDAEIRDYVRTSNYFAPDRSIALTAVLAAVPAQWDADENGRWDGLVPDARFAFDGEGFDRTPDGGYTGWRAYAYHPLPGTFFPTNGAIGDVLIRLPEALRSDERGSFDLRIYQLNLAVLEALIARRDVAIEPVDEARYQVDLDGDGQLGTAHNVAFRESTPPTQAASALSFVGRARSELAAGRLHLHPGLFPEGTELLHSVRYLDPAPAGVRLAARMKELRYARKHTWVQPRLLEERAAKEAQEKENAPFERRSFGGDIERGVDNAQGWRYSGFIEDAAGALRPQSFEESAYCVGCHGGVGATSDGIFSFERKLDASAFQRGWFHWTQRDLAGVADRRLPDGETEYARYLERNGAADEFRQNAEVAARFFTANGALKPEMRARLTRDVSSLLVPSVERALALDKAYRELVKRQSFRLGRELVLDGARNVHRDVPPGLATGVEQPLLPAWRLASDERASR